MDARQGLGRRGERIAEEYLAARGYVLVERNYRCPLGEIDLIFLDGRVLVFVEVKLRRDNRFAPPLEAVDRHKRRRLIQAAQFFLTQHRQHHRDARFDVIGICLDGPVVQHVPNAFELNEEW